MGIWALLGQSLGPLFQANPVLALRLPSLLSYTLAQLLLCEATRLWFGRRAALLAAWLANLAPLLFVCGGLLLLPDSPLLLLLSLLLWWLARQPLQAPRRPWQSLSFGAILGLLSLCKYQGLLVILTLVALRLAGSLRQRRLHARDTALIAAGWLASSWPLWLWNLQNGWLSFGFHAGRTAAVPSFRWEGPPLFLLSQLGLLFPSVGLLLLLALLRGPGAGRGREAAGQLRLLAAMQLLLFLPLAGRMQVLASWLVPCWWLLLPVAAAALARPALWGRRWIRRLGLLTLLLVPALTLATAAHVRWGIARRILPAGLDTSGQLLPPEVLRSELQRHPRLWRRLQQAEQIASNRYELPGFMALALAGHSQAEYSSYSGDNRGFDVWRRQLNRHARRGVLFAVVGDYMPLALLQGSPLQPWWQIQPLEPLGRVPIHRGGEVVTELEFYGFDPSRVRRLLPGPLPEPQAGQRRAAAR